MLRRPRDRRANHYLAIWQWLNLELWMRRTFDEAPAAVAGAA